MTSSSPGHLFGPAKRTDFEVSPAGRTTRERHRDVDSIPTASLHMGQTSTTSLNLHASTASSGPSSPFSLRDHDAQSVVAAAEMTAEITAGPQPSFLPLTAASLQLQSSTSPLTAASLQLHLQPAVPPLTAAQQQAVSDVTLLVEAVDAVESLVWTFGKGDAGNFVGAFLALLPRFVSTVEAAFPVGEGDHRRTDLIARAGTLASKLLRMRIRWTTARGGFTDDGLADATQLQLGICEEAASTASVHGAHPTMSPSVRPSPPGVHTMISWVPGAVPRLPIPAGSSEETEVDTTAVYASGASVRSAFGHSGIAAAAEEARIAHRHSSAAPVSTIIDTGATTSAGSEKGAQAGATTERLAVDTAGTSPERQQRHFRRCISAVRAAMTLLEMQ